MRRPPAGGGAAAAPLPPAVAPPPPAAAGGGGQGARRVAARNARAGGLPGGGGDDGGSGSGDGDGGGDGSGSDDEEGSGSGEEGGSGSGDGEGSGDDDMYARPATEPYSRTVLRRLCQTDAVAALKYFGRYFCKVNGQSPMYMQVDPDARKSIIKFIKKSDLLANFSDYTTTPPAAANGRPGKPVSIAKLWLNFPGKIEYARVIFRPYNWETYDPNRDENVLNMWRGWEAGPFDSRVGIDNSPAGRARLKPILRHLHEVLCSGNRDMTAYVLKHLKRILIGKKTGVCLVFIGEQGTGSRSN